MFYTLVALGQLVATTDTPLSAEQLEEWRARAAPELDNVPETIMNVVRALEARQFDSLEQLFQLACPVEADFSNAALYVERLVNATFLLRQAPTDGVVGVLDAFRDSNVVRRVFSQFSSGTGVVHGI